MITVGMDVHIRNSFLHVTDEREEIMRRGRCPNTLLGLGTFLGPVEREAKARREPIRVVLESTSNSRGIRGLLERYGREAGLDLTVDVLDARKLRIIAESVRKSDAVDASVLNELARSHLQLPTCYLPDDEEFALREHLRARHDLVRLRTMLKNRVHAVLHRRAILRPANGLFSSTGRAFLRALSLDEAGRSVLERFLVGIEQIEALIEQSTCSLHELARTPRWAKPVALLCTMPGVGRITSLTILAELGNIQRFRSRAAVAHYAGLVPVTRNSNEKRYAGGITRRGPAHLRAVLVQAAWIAVPRVPFYYALFCRIAHKTNKGKAVVAVARRMLEDAYTMLKRDEAFRFVSVSPRDASKKEQTVRRPSTSPSGRKVASSVAG